MRHEDEMEGSMLYLQGFMIQLETGIQTQVRMAVIAHHSAHNPVPPTLTAVRAVALTVRVLGVVRVARPPSPWWTSLLLAIALGRISCCELVHELDAEVEL